MGIPANDIRTNRLSWSDSQAVPLADVRMSASTGASTKGLAQGNDGVFGSLLRIPAVTDDVDRSNCPCRFWSRKSQP